MQQLVTPVVPFPNMFWWLCAHETDIVTFDYAEHFEKMSYRNRYYITGANGLIKLTVPLQHGRNQRTAMQEVTIDNREQWQQQHWRTITSVYGRAPFFEHYADELEKLFVAEHTQLVAFNMTGILWLKKQLGISYTEVIADEYEKVYPDAQDIRSTFKPAIEKKAQQEELYYQLFGERNGFYPNLSMLDLLLSEGPAAKLILQQHTDTIKSWMR